MEGTDEKSPGCTINAALQMPLGRMLTNPCNITYCLLLSAVKKWLMLCKGVTEKTNTRTESGTGANLMLISLHCHSCKQITNLRN